MAYNDEYIKALSTKPELDEKIQVNITDSTETLYWYIEFNLHLDPSSVSSKTMSVTDKEGYILETDISYIEDKNLIKIEPLEKYTENQYYILNISEDVRSEHKNNLKEKVHILFKIKKQRVMNIKVLPPNIIVPLPKHKKGYKKIRKRAESKSKVYLFEREGNNVDKLNLESVSIKINPIIGAVGLILVIIAALANIKQLIFISAIIAVVGFLHIVYQVLKKETRSRIFYNFGVSNFKKEKYEKAERYFNKALFIDEKNEYAEYAVNKMSYYS